MSPTSYLTAPPRVNSQYIYSESALIVKADCPTFSFRPSPIGMLGGFGNQRGFVA